MKKIMLLLTLLLFVCVSVSAASADNALKDCKLDRNRWQLVESNNSKQAASFIDTTSVKAVGPNQVEAMVYKYFYGNRCESDSCKLHTTKHYHSEKCRFDTNASTVTILALGTVDNDLNVVDMFELSPTLQIPDSFKRNSPQDKTMQKTKLLVKNDSRFAPTTTKQNPVVQKNKANGPVLNGQSTVSKEKEAIWQAEQAAMAIQLPVILKLGPGVPTQSQVEAQKRSEQAFLDTESYILSEMRKNDAKIAELERTASETEKADLKAFKVRIHQARIAYVRRISMGKLRGDTFVVGVGSTWQEIEMALGEPVTKRSEYNYDYGGLTFKDWHSKGALPAGYKFVSKGPQAVEVTSERFVSDAGVRIGMSCDEVLRILQSKYVKKENYQKDTLHTGKTSGAGGTGDFIAVFSMQGTLPHNIFCDFRNDRLVRYMVSPH